MSANSIPCNSSYACSLIVLITRSVIGMGFLLNPTTLHAELLCMVLMLYTKCPPPSSLGRRYNAAKLLILSTLLVVPPLTAYTHDPGGYGGSFILLPVMICLGDITGCTPPFLLMELIIFTVDITNSLIKRAGIRLILFDSIDLTHLTLSFTNRIALSMKGTCELASQHSRVIPCSFNTVLHDSNAQSA